MNAMDSGMLTMGLWLVVLIIGLKVKYAIQARLKRRRDERNATTAEGAT